MNKEDALILTLNKQINELADSIEKLANITNETLNTTVNLTKHLAQLQQDFITLLNRFNEMELNLDSITNGLLDVEKKLTKKEPLVMPVPDWAKTRRINTPYPKPKGHLRRIFKGLRRFVGDNAST